MYQYTGHEKCPQCSDLLDDHQLPHDVSEPYLLLRAEETGEDVITCGECGDCNWDYRDYDPVEERKLDLESRGDQIMDQRRDDAMTNAMNREGY